MAIDAPAVAEADRHRRPDPRPGRPVAWLVAALVVIAGLAACGDDGPATPSPATPTRPVVPSPSGPSSPAPTAATPTATAPIADFEVEIEGARTDLARRFGYDPMTIDVDLVETVTWPDAGRGCPKTGVQYEPAPMAGYRIVLRVNELLFHYHGVDGDPTPLLCQFLD